MRPPARRAITDIPASAVVAIDAVRAVGAVLDELDELLDAADLGAEHERRRRRVANDEEPAAHGLGVRHARRRARWRRRRRTRSPSGCQPRAAGSGRTSHSANGRMPTSQTAPRIGVAAARPRSSISHFAPGVSTMPPADSPVDATRQGDRSPDVVPAGDHGRHRDQPGAGEPEGEDAVHDVELPPLRRPDRAAASDAAPAMAPPTIGMRTSRRAISRATYSPVTPPTTK